MRRWLSIFALSSLLAGTAAHAQPADPCGAMPKAGTEAAKHFLTFDRFDKELRLALTNQDALALSFLVQFPLKVNEASGTIHINDAGALKAHFQDVFPAELRKGVLGDKDGKTNCGAEGLMYGPGLLWVQPGPRGYGLYVVNRGAVGPENDKRERIDYTCQTLSHRIVIDTLANGTLRYRSWNKPKLLTEAPDLELTRGEQTFEGSNVCAIPIYSFKNGTATYTVEAGMGCDAEADTPKDATGSLVVGVGKKRNVSTSCF